MRYRCSHRGNSTRKAGTECGQRASLKKSIDKYKRRPLCPGCGRDSLLIDKAHHVRKRKLKCSCQGVPYPHERGTLPLCENYKGILTEEQHREAFDAMTRRYA